MSRKVAHIVAQRRLKQVPDLLDRWRAKLEEERGPDLFPIDPSPTSATTRLERRKCIDELEEVLARKAEQ